MHQISVQQLAVYIPKPMCEWSSQDICTWFSLNQIQIQVEKVKANELNGDSIKKVSPQDWIEIYGATKYIARQIVQWLEDELQEFQQIIAQAKHSIDVQEVENCSKNHQIVQSSSINLQQQEVLSQNNTYKLFQQNNQLNLDQYTDQNIRQKQDVDEQRGGSRKIKSCQHIQQQDDTQIMQGKQVKKHSLLDRPENRSNINGINTENQNRKQKLQHINKQSAQFNKQYIPSKYFDGQGQQEDCHITERAQSAANIQIQKIQINSDQDIGQKQKNNPSFNRQILKNQSQIIGQYANVAKWNKKSKQHNKIPIQLTKVNSKYPVNRQPKIYNYLNKMQNNILQRNNPISTKNEQKRGFTSQQVFPSKMVSPTQKADYKIPTKQKAPTKPLIQAPVSPHIKFTTSQFIPYYPQPSSFPVPSSLLTAPAFQKKLKIICQPNYEKTITGFAKIGRLQSSQINFTDETVSRAHAEIIPRIEMSGQNKFYLKDVGSKFGTFVESGTVQGGIQGKSFLIGNAQVQIIKVELSKSSQQSNANILLPKKQTFDIKIKIDNEKQLTILNRSTITIGKSQQQNQHRILDGCQNARIFTNPDKGICLEAIEGRLYQKLSEHQFWDIEANLDKQMRVRVVFGWLRTVFEVIWVCLGCDQKRGICHCEGPEVKVERQIDLPQRKQILHKNNFK